MDDFVGTARVLIAVGFALMLVMLRLDAGRFGTAEYYEGTRDGERPSIKNRHRRSTFSWGPGIARSPWHGASRTA